MGKRYIYDPQQFVKISIFHKIVKLLWGGSSKCLFLQKIIKFN
jgi:hypothetical protein